MMYTAPAVKSGTLIGYICDSDDQNIPMDEYDNAYLPFDTCLSKEDHGRGKVLSSGNLVLVDASRQYRHWEGFTTPEDYQSKMQQMILVLPDGRVFVSQDIDGYGQAAWVGLEDGEVMWDVP